MTTDHDLLRPENILQAKDCIKATLHVNQPTAGAAHALCVALAALEACERAASPAPFFKVTEVEGFTEWSRGRSGSEDFCIMAAHEVAHGLGEMLPDVSMPLSEGFEADKRGARGRFRITVEFMPEVKP